MNERLYPTSAKSSKQLTKINGPDAGPCGKVERSPRILYRGKVKITVQHDKTEFVQHVHSIILRFIVGKQVRWKVTISFESWMARQEEANPYSHRGSYGSDGRSRGESRAPTMSATRCTTIYMPKNIYEHAVGVRGVMVS